jgi:tRNA A22 N-methylase
MKEFVVFKDNSVNSLEKNIKRWLENNKSTLENISICVDNSYFYATVVYTKKPL